MEETKTLPGTWKASLSLLLTHLEAESGGPPKIAILGVGNPLRSDDAAGLRVAQALSRSRCAADTHRVLVLEAGQAPENSTGELRRFAPGLVLIVDAADMGKEPGTIQWIPEEDIDGMSASTHSLPLFMLARYLRLELKCTVALLGIQPASNEVGERLSPEVWQSMNGVANGLDELFLPQRAGKGTA